MFDGGNAARSSWVQGHGKYRIDITPPLAVATLGTPLKAMKFIRSRKLNATAQTYGYPNNLNPIPGRKDASAK